MLFIPFPIIPATSSQSTKRFWDARNSGSVYFKGKQEVVALHSSENDHVVVSATYDGRGRKYLSQLKAILLLSLLNGTVVSFFVGYFVSGQVAASDQKIADDVNEISAKNLQPADQDGYFRR